jgi:uncharacterized protein (TIGR03435 family)
MNKLSEKFKGEPVVFLSVTDEPSDTVTKFLKTHEMRSWAGIDEAKSSLKAFKVSGRPDGYLIGKDGTLLARIRPVNLTEKELTEAIGDKFKPQPIDWEPLLTPKRSTEAGRILFELAISTAYGKPRMSSSQNSLEIQSASFIGNIAKIWGMQYSQVIADTQPVSSFNLTLQTPRGKYYEGVELLKSAVQFTFGIRVTPEQRETDVFILSLSTAPDALRPKPGAPEIQLGLLSYGSGVLIGTAEMPEIARALWMGLDRPVIDETGLKGVYEFEMNWKPEDRSELERLLEGQGLALVPAKRTVEFLRITPAKP